MVRTDLGTDYLAIKGTDTIKIGIMVLLKPTDENFPKEVLDSFDVLRWKGYKIIRLNAYVFKYVDCDVCLDARNKNLSAECVEYE